MTSQDFSVAVDASSSVVVSAFVDIVTGSVEVEPQADALVTVNLEQVLPMPAIDQGDDFAVNVTFLRGERGPKGDPGPKGEPGTASVQALTKTDILKLF